MLKPSTVSMSRRWQHGLSIGIGLPLLLGIDPARAAESADVAVSGIATGMGLVAALGAVLGVGDAAIGTGGVVAAAGGIAALVSGAWLWRSQRARVGGPWRAVRRRKPVDVAAPARAPVSIPAGLDGDQVLAAARARFLRLQQAWDACDVAALQSLTTPDMLDELMDVLGARAAGPSRTDVISLDAKLLCLEELSAAYLASVEFSGLIRESAERGAVPFRELWMLASVKGENPSWRLARQQSLF